MFRSTLSSVKAGVKRTALDALCRTLMANGDHHGRRPFGVEELKLVRVDAITPC